MGKSIKFRQQSMGQLVCTNLPLVVCIDCATGCGLQTRKKMGKSIKFRQQRGQLCTNLLCCCIDCATGCGLQTRKPDGKINQVQTTKRSVSVYKLTPCLHGLCHRMWFADKETDGKINQVQTTRGQLVCTNLLTCMDCATGCGLQTRKKMGKSIKFRQQRGQ